MKQRLFAVAAAAIFAVAAYLFELPKLAGAHPFWSDTVILIGTPIGLILGLVTTRLPYTVRMIALAALLGTSIVAATFGKRAFAASYAENVFAGQVWYFGWIAVCISCAAFISSAAWPKKSLPT